MNPSRDVTLETRLLGHWILSHEGSTLPPGAKRLGPKSTLTELVLESGNQFTGRVREGDSLQTSGVYGYWDVRENQLRMGCSAEDAAGAPVLLEDDMLALGPGPRAYFRRVCASAK